MHSNRYSPAQRKAIRLLEHSRDVFGYDVVNPEDRKLLVDLRDAKRRKPERGWKGVKGMLRVLGKTSEAGNGESKNRSSKSGDMTEEDIWSTVVEGDLLSLRRLIAIKGFDVRKHRDDKGGSTILHYATLFGHFDIVNWILSSCRRMYGREAVERIVNTKGTAQHKSTPLIEACRSSVGPMEDRVKIVHILIQNGASVSQQDASGDTSLHWAARTRNVPVLRALLKEGGPEAKVAMATRNFFSRTPLDVAKIAVEKKKGSAGLGYWNVLILSILEKHGKAQS